MPSRAREIERRISHEHVGALDEAAEHGAPLGLSQVERDAALRAVVDDPPVVVRALGHAGSAQPAAIQIPVGRLDLDDLGPEVGQDGSGHGAGDIARRVDHAQAVEERSVAHPSTHYSGTDHARGGRVTRRGPEGWVL
jgi:hypothetical protein